MNHFALLRDTIDMLAHAPVEVVILGWAFGPVLIACLILRIRAVREQSALQRARADMARSTVAAQHLLATVSHELCTPLNAIIGFSEMLSKEAPDLDSTRRQEYARMINGSGQHLLSVVNLLLDGPRSGSSHLAFAPEAFAPGPLVRECCDLLALKAREAGLDLLMRIEPDLPDIVADRRALKQIVFNLLANAIKFTDPGGRVTVRLAVDLHALILTVEDTGIGIAEAYLDRLGRPFVRARNSGERLQEGVGLGLSIVNSLVALHGGRMDIRSRLGEGTSINVHLMREGQPAKSATSTMRDRCAAAWIVGESDEPYSVKKRA